MLFDPNLYPGGGLGGGQRGEREIDEINILNARLKAMDLAIHKLDPAPDFALIDGNRNSGITLPNRAVVHGDSLSASISAASVLAKVSRDRICWRWRSGIRNIILSGTKDTAPSCTMRCCGNTDPARSTARSFLKNL